MKLRAVPRIVNGRDDRRVEAGGTTRASTRSSITARQFLDGISGGA
jgi:hypothetical protein